MKMSTKGRYAVMAMIDIGQNSAGNPVSLSEIAERIDWKSDLYRKVAPHLGADCIFASNTSGLSINELAQAFPEAQRHRFCGIHFFNPPRYMHLV